MDDFRLHPERRVFHLDTECYIVYIGNDTDDYKPFLRIGNTAHLSKELRELTHPIVITDTYTGSPLLESRNLSDILGDDFRYVGDPDTVERFKRFLKHLEFPSEGFESGGSEEMEDRGVFVYFYDDGNIRIKYHKSEIFHLGRREESDVHYPERAKRIKNILSRSQLRIPQKELAEPGFFVRGGALYLFSKRAIAAVGVRDEYFAELAQAGLDPDRISAVVADEVNEGLLRLFKRTRGKQETLRILTGDPAGVDPAVDLFRGRERLGLRAEAVKLQADRFTSVLDFRIQKSGGRFNVEHPDLDLRMQLPSSEKPKQERLMTLDPSANLAFYRSSSGNVELSLLEGVPYRIAAAPDPAEAASTYLPQKISLISDVVGEGEAGVLQQSVAFFQELAQGADTEQTVRSLRSNVREMSGEATGVFWAYAANAVGLARLRLQDAGENRKLRRALEGFISALAGELKEKPGMSTYPSLVCDLVITGEDVVPLYRFTASLTPDKIAFGGEVSREIAESVTYRDEEHFAAEAERLDELLESLDTTKARVPKAAREQQTAEQSEGDEKRREESKRAEQDREKTKSSRESRAAASTDTSALSAAASSAGGGRRRGSRKGGNGGKIAAAAAVLLLLLGGVLAYLYLGTDVPARLGLPYASVAQEDGAAEDDGPAEGDGVADVGDGAAPGDVADATAGNGEGTAASGGEGPGAVESGSEQDSGEELTATGPATEEERALAEAYEEGPRPAGLEELGSVGGLTITILDIIRLANRIAVANGYRPLGGVPSEGPDPDWIYPGNVFELPDGSQETVVRGDTLWYITTRFIDAELRERYARYQELIADYDAGSASESERDDLVSELQSLREATYSEQFAALLQDEIRTIRAGGSPGQEASE